MRCMSVATMANIVTMLLALTPLSAKGDEVLSPAAQRGIRYRAH